MSSQRIPGPTDVNSQLEFGPENVCRIPRYIPKSVGAANVSDWTLADRFTNVIRRTGPKLPKEIQEEFQALLAPEAIAVVVGVLVVWAGSHAFGVGFVADIVLLVVGAAFLGYQVWTVAGDFASFIEKTYNAKTDTDLEEAAAHLANFIAVVGVAAFLAVLAKGVKGQGGKLANIKLKLSTSRAYYMRVLGWARKPTAVLNRLDVAIGFFTRNGKKLRQFDGGLKQDVMDGYIKGIDFSQDVFVHRLGPNQKFKDIIPGSSNQKIQLIQYTDNYQTNFYTLPGTSPGDLAIPSPHNKKFRLYEIIGNIEVLVSKTTGLGPKQFGIKDEFVGGGAYQIIIPDPGSNVRLIRKN